MPSPNSSLAQVGKGTVLSMGSFPLPGTPDYAAIAEVIDSSMPSLEPTDVEVTNQDTPNNSEEMIPGINKPGTVPLELNYGKAQHATLYAAVGVMKTFKIVYPDGGNWVFAGYLKFKGGKVPIKDRITANWDIQVSGKPAFSTT